MGIAMDAVTASISLKLVNDAKATAQPTLDQGNSLYNSSAGQMENDGYRTSLREKCDNLQNLINSSDSVPEQITNAANEVTSAMSEVNSNIEYKKQQDAAAAAAAAAAAQQAQQQAQQNTYYQNCTAVRKAGKAPLHTGDPGYSRKLDRDGDGIACE